MEKTTDKIENGNEASYRLSTMLPFEVFTELIRYCKENTRTGLGKWDIGLGIKMLLIKAKYADKLERIESRLIKLEKEDKIHG